MDTDEAKLVFQKYDEMVDLLNNYCVNVYSQWSAKVDIDCQISLDQPLLLRDPETNVLKVNFSKQVCFFFFSYKRNSHITVLIMY